MSLSAAVSTTTGSLERLQKVQDIGRAEEHASSVCNIGLSQLLSNLLFDCRKILSAVTAPTEGVAGSRKTILRPATADGNDHSTSDMPATQRQGAGEIPVDKSA